MKFDIGDRVVLRRKCVFRNQSAEWHWPENTEALVVGMGEEVLGDLEWVELEIGGFVRTYAPVELVRRWHDDFKEGDLVELASDFEYAIEETFTFKAGTRARVFHIEEIAHDDDLLYLAFDSHDGAVIPMEAWNARKISDT